MSLPETDPRIFFAAERTLLAWLRSGLTIIGVGFVVARFGLLLELLSAQHEPVAAQSRPSAILGVLFVTVGAIAILLATLQHQRFVSTLPEADLPQSYSRALALILCAVVGVLGIILAGYLVVSHA